MPLLALLALLVSAPTNLQASEKAYSKMAEKLSTKAAAKLPGKKVAVLPFDYADGHVSQGQKLVAEKLTNGLVEAGTLTVIERSMVEKVLKELKFESSGAIDADSAKQIGKGLGVDAIVTGMLEDAKNGKSATISARVIKTDTFEILASDEREVEKTWKDAPKRGLVLARPFAQACQTEIDKYCKDVRIGGGRVIRCLASRRSDLSDACVGYIDKHGARLQKS